VTPVSATYTLLTNSWASESDTSPESSNQKTGKYIGAMLGNQVVVFPSGVGIWVSGSMKTLTVYELLSALRSHCEAR